MTYVRRLLTVALLVLHATPAAGDDWAAPKKTTARSPSGVFQATVDPDTAKLRVEKQGTLIFERAYVAMPVAMLVSDQGQVVTLDEWAGSGGRHSLVVYAAGGDVLVDRRLEELLTNDELSGKLARTVSSRGWRAGDAGARFDGAEVVIPTAWNTNVRIRLDGTGFAIPTDEERFRSYLDGTRRYDSLLVTANWNPDRDGYSRCVVEKTRSTCVGDRSKTRRYKEAEFKRMLAAAAGFAPYIGNDRPSDDYWAIGFTFYEGDVTYGYSIRLPPKPPKGDAALKDAFLKLKKLTGLK